MPLCCSVRKVYNLGRSSCHMCISEPDVIKQHGKVRKAVRWPAMISVLAWWWSICWYMYWAQHCKYWHVQLVHWLWALCLGDLVHNPRVSLRVGIFLNLLKCSVIYVYPVTAPSLSVYNTMWSGLQTYRLSQAPVLYWLVFLIQSDNC